MTAPVFWSTLAGVDAGQTVLLEGAEGHHAADVRRLRVGESLLLTDGAGRSATGVVAVVGRGQLEVRVDVVEVSERPEPRVVVVQALAKGDRGETAVETLVEVGVDAIVPWAASRCVTRWNDERGGKALERWRSTAREAAKQSRRVWWPEVADLASTAEVAARLRDAAVGVVLHAGASRPLTGAAMPVTGDVVVVVGPEGGISDEELALLGAAGAAAYGLGPTVLRTSTAGTVAAAVLLATAGRWA